MADIALIQFKSDKTPDKIQLVINFQNGKPQLVLCYVDDGGDYSRPMGLDDVLGAIAAYYDEGWDAAALESAIHNAVDSGDFTTINVSKYAR